MAQAHVSTSIALGSDVCMIGPADYLDSISTCLRALLVAALAAPAEVEPAIVSALRAQGELEGLDAADVAFLLMSCTLVDERDDDRVSVIPATEG